jgi:hypothetical protein
MAHAYNSSYWGGRDQEHCGSNPAREIGLKTPSQKYPIQKKAGGVTHVVELLPSKHEALSSNSLKHTHT